VSFFISALKPKIKKQNEKNLKNSQLEICKMKDAVFQKFFDALKKTR
jgi:hypothetical protein